MSSQKYKNVLKNVDFSKVFKKTFVIEFDNFRRENDADRATLKR